MTANRLDGLRAARGRLLPGEVVTVVVGVAAELARLHAARRAHGALDATAVTIDPAGRPRLHGVRSADSGADADTGADVRALARLAGELLGPAPPRSVVDVLADADAGRHTATSFAAALLGACRPEPVRVPGERPAGPQRLPVIRPASAGTPGAWWPRRRERLAAVRERLPRARLVAAVVAPFLLLACLLLWAEARPGRTEAARPAHTVPVTVPPTPSATPHTRAPTHTATASGWLGRLDGLDRRRAVAYAHGDPTGLRLVYVAGSRALAADTATLHRYVADGLRVRGMRLEVSRLTVIRRSGRTVVLAVTDRLAGYDVVDTSGRVVRHEPGRGPVTWRITLRDVEGRWLIADSRRS